VHIVTQFCFDATAMLKWIARLRDFGIEHPVRVGLAGPTSLATLLRYAQRCGVRASAQGLARQAGLVRQLFALSAPDALVRKLGDARAERHLGEIAPHFFSFGGLARTARWAQAVAERRIAIEAGEGFRVEPPREG
jgi:methylenetetrahydrofolate reductase (NADPH)